MIEHVSAGEQQNQNQTDRRPEVSIPDQWHQIGGEDREGSEEADDDGDC